MSTRTVTPYAEIAPIIARLRTRADDLEHIAPQAAAAIRSTLDLCIETGDEGPGAQLLAEDVIRAMAKAFGLDTPGATDDR